MCGGPNIIGRQQRNRIDLLGANNAHTHTHTPRAENLGLGFSSPGNPVRRESWRAPVRGYINWLQQRAKTPFVGERERKREREKGR